MYVFCLFVCLFSTRDINCHQIWVSVEINDICIYCVCTIYLVILIIIEFVAVLFGFRFHFAHNSCHICCQYVYVFIWRLYTILCARFWGRNRHESQMQRRHRSAVFFLFLFCFIENWKFVFFFLICEDTHTRTHTQRHVRDREADENQNNNKSCWCRQKVNDL